MPRGAKPGLGDTGRITDHDAETENLAAIRSVYERWAEGDFRAGVELFDPEIVFVIGSGFPDTGTYLGRAQVAEYMKGLLEPWTEFTIEAEEVIEAGEMYVVGVCQRGVGSASGLATEIRYFHVWTFRGRTVTRWENFRERADALAAAGIRD